jgi:hypothetical protein
MQGQFYGSFEGTDGSKGFVWTLVDPDRTIGQAAFSRQTGERSIAELRVLSVADRTFDVEILRNEQLERFYAPAVRPMDPNVQFRAQLTLDARGGAAQGVVRDVQGVVTGSVSLMRLTPWSAPAERTLGNWRECKEWMDSHRHEGPSLYRGQSRPLPMTTTFHRTGRVDLIRYLLHDVNVFADYVTTYGERTYDMTQASDRGAVVALAQHHGFPSPLLDWSASPYIAASFAFTGVIESAPSGDPARLFRLTPTFIRDFPTNGGSLMISPWPKVELFRPPSLGNTRMLSQQGMFLFSNVPSPEAQLQILERHFNKKYLEVVDIPADVMTCKEALSDLRRMGITAASLFPGLDGIGRALKHEFFYAYDGHRPSLSTKTKRAAMRSPTAAGTRKGSAPKSKK